MLELPTGGGKTGGGRKQKPVTGCLSRGSVPEMVFLLLLKSPVRGKGATRLGGGGKGFLFTEEVRGQMRRAVDLKKPL